MPLNSDSDFTLRPFASNFHTTCSFFVETQCLHVFLRQRCTCLLQNIEWIVDNTQPAQSQGFTIDPLKGSVDIDSTKDLVFTWNPPENYDVSFLVIVTQCDVCIELKLLFGHSAHPSILNIHGSQTPCTSLIKVTDPSGPNVAINVWN